MRIQGAQIQEMTWTFDPLQSKMRTPISASWGGFNLYR
jgi:hypothetical protein